MPMRLQTSPRAEDTQSDALVHLKRFRPSNDHWTNVDVDAISGPNQIAPEAAKHCSIRVKLLHDWEYITLHWRIVFSFSLVLFTNVGISSISASGVAGLRDAIVNSGGELADNDGAA
jgi:hypothetical protein